MTKIPARLMSVFRKRFASKSKAAKPARRFIVSKITRLGETIKWRVS